MKFRIVHGKNSPRALMITRDDHDSALSAAPKHRHHFQNTILNIVIYQHPNKKSGMIHNHPSGDPMPSQGDIDMTKAIVAAGKPLKIGVHDHLIVGREGVASLKHIGAM